MWHVTTDTFWGVNILSKCQLPSSYRCDLWYYEDLEEKDDLPNQLMNRKAVYRTAPATPGLLNSPGYTKSANYWVQAWAKRRRHWQTKTNKFWQNLAKNGQNRAKNQAITGKKNGRMKPKPGKTWPNQKFHRILVRDRPILTGLLTYCAF